MGSFDYKPPTPFEVRALLRGLGLSKADAAKLLGVPRRHVTLWCSEQRREYIPYAVLRELARLQLGLYVDVVTWRDELSRYIAIGAQDDAF